MQDVEAPTLSETAILEALGRFRFMTTLHMVRLGVSPSLRHVQKVLRGMVNRHRPLVGSLDFGSIPTIGKLHRLFYLTERGASVLEDVGYPAECINWPQKVRLFPHDYWHRIDCIDFHITAELWARENGGEIPLFDTYYDHGKIGADGRAHPRSRVAWGDGALVPDAMLNIAHNDRARLFAFEMHKGTDTARLTPKLKTYVKACRDRVLETPYDYDKSARILLVFDNEATLKRLAGRIERDGLLEERAAQFFGHTIEGLKDDFLQGWTHFQNGQETTLF